MRVREHPKSGCRAVVEKVGVPSGLSLPFRSKSVPATAADCINRRDGRELTIRTVHFVTKRLCRQTSTFYRTAPQASIDIWSVITKSCSLLRIGYRRTKEPTTPTSRSSFCGFRSIDVEFQSSTRPDIVYVRNRKSWCWNSRSVTKTNLQKSKQFKLNKYENINTCLQSSFKNIRCRYTRWRSQYLDLYQS